MALIEWTDDYCTGIEEIDGQHRHLVEIINKFDEAAGKGKGSRVMDEILNDLIGYTQEHFQCEEKLMADNGYPELPSHQRQHRQLLQKVERCQFEFTQEGRRVTGEVRDLLKYWLTAHILSEDMDYKAHLNGEAEPAHAES